MGADTTTGQRTLAPRSVGAGVIGAIGISMLYVLVVALASGSWDHLVEQLRADWYLLVLVVAGFATQVTLLAELRRRHRLQATAAAASGAGVGASTAGMIACCAHHIADLLPFIGAGGAATFLYGYKIPFVLGGVGINVIGVVVAARRLRRTPLATPETMPLGATEHDDLPAGSVA